MKKLKKNSVLKTGSLMVYGNDCFIIQLLSWALSIVWEAFGTRHVLETDSVLVTGCKGEGSYSDRY
jgi:hypothetical protein